MSFDLSKYETVKQRKARFYEEHKDGRIIVECINTEKITDQALFKACIFLTSEDQKNNLPRGIGYAFEIRDKELQTNSYGKQYESVNFSSWCENAEESAVGRALDNAGYASSPSRDEMEKAQRMNKTLSNTKTQPINNSNATDPHCKKCDSTTHYQESKTGKGMWVCNQDNGACMTQAKDGKMYKTVDWVK